MAPVALPPSPPCCSARFAAKSALICRRAHLTIAAARARRVSEGFLQDRPREILGTVLVSLPFLCPSRLPTTFCANALDEVRLSKLAFDKIPAEPIHARGWCFQELCMSPRALVFGLHTSRFRCRTATATVGSSFYDPNALWTPVLLWRQ